MEKTLDYINSNLFIKIAHNDLILTYMKDFHNITCPVAYPYNINYFKERRDSSKPLQTKIYYHNKIKRIFESAEKLITSMYPEDITTYDISPNEIKDILDSKKLEYEVDTYKQKLLKKQ